MLSRITQHFLVGAMTMIVCAAASSRLEAHFPWLVRQDDGRLTLYFGENLADRTYKTPPSIAAAKLAQITPSGAAIVPSHSVEGDALVGLLSDFNVANDTWYMTQATFGIYRGSKLDYYAMHRAGAMPQSRDAYRNNLLGLELQAHLIDTETGIDCYAVWKGQPLADIEVHMYDAAGSETATAKTDAAGKVSFSDAQVATGLNGIMLGHRLNEPGKLADAAYDTQSHYLTVTFHDPEADNEAQASLPALPVEITSFGACRLGDSIYVFGGNTGSAHGYSNQSQSDALFQWNLNHSKLGWQRIATGPRLQGLGMVAHQQHLILAGGFTAMNDEGEEQDLRSQSQVQAFDVMTKAWRELPSLPQPRSSHDAALVGNTLYVVGGWNLQGSSETLWHDTALAMDLSATPLVWKEIAKPPFTRRALALVEHEGQLFAIGGMTQDGRPTRDVTVYDPAGDTWKELPPLVGDKPMAGFGAAGWSINGQLVVTTYEGTVQVWDTAAATWRETGKTRDARFFHRLMPWRGASLVAIGGANMEQGKFASLEIVHTKPEGK